MPESRWSRIIMAVAQKVDWAIGWHHVWRPLGIFPIFVGLRKNLQAENLHDTRRRDEPVVGATEEERALYAGCRRVDGRFNDFVDPGMGSVGCRFGRNVPLPLTVPDKEPEMLSPNPRVVSQELLARRSFIPARSLNVLAAAWLQFEVHDWFSHGKQSLESYWSIPVGEDDSFPDKPMRILRTPVDPLYDPERDGPAPTYVSDDTHWWDGSQIYTSKEDKLSFLRHDLDGGRLWMGPDGLPPQELDAKLELDGVEGNGWVGLAVLHILFMLEHNAICARLEKEYPTMSGDDIFEKARLINAGLMAKIHATEWTPGIIGHPTTRLGSRINWYGLVGGALKRFPWVRENEVLHGIPGSPVDQHDVPYSLTEEFIAVYRMHPLMPDEFEFRALANGGSIATLPFSDLRITETRSRLSEIGVANSFYSLGIAHPGALTLHNYPNSLRDFDRADGKLRIDLAATDILRDRERGVPRYANFRELFHRRPVASFEDITPNRQWVKEIRELYEDELDRVDLMVGLYAETPPKGLGFSDTAFRVFMLMATRRLQSDRFFTTDYRPDVYTPVGMRWIEENTMTSVLLRHYPELEPALQGVRNPFAPWRRVDH